MKTGPRLIADFDPGWTCIHRYRCKEAQTCNGKVCKPMPEKPQESAS